MEVELIVKPPSNEELGEFVQEHPELSLREATFALSIIKGCQSLGNVDCLKEQALISSSVELLQENGFNASIAYSIQKQWKSLIDSQPLLLGVTRENVPDALTEFILGAWNRYNFDYLSIEDATFIGQVLLAMWQETPAPEEVVMSFFNKALIIFNDFEVKPQAGMYVQKLWKELVNGNQGE